MTALSYVSGAQRRAAAGHDDRPGAGPRRRALARPAGADLAEPRRRLELARVARSGRAISRRVCWRWACKRGERIGCWSLNRPEWTLTQFAAAEAGLVFVTINPAYRLHELEYALSKVGCAALVTATRFKTSDFIGMINALAPELAREPAGRAEGATAAGPAHGDPDRRDRAGRARLRGGRARAAPAQLAALDALRGGVAVRRSRQHPVHLAAPPARPRA